MILRSLTILLLIFALFNCDDDEHYHPHEHEHTHEDDEALCDYYDVEVDFFQSHPEFELRVAEFEEVEEIVLVKAEHKQGARFELVTEQVYVRSPYTSYKIQDSTAISIVENAEENLIIDLNCFHFLKEEEFIQENFDTEYLTITREAVAEQGTGEVVPAEYRTISKFVIVQEAEITRRDNLERKFQRVKFRIPCEMTAKEYLEDQMAKHSMEPCEYGNSYQLVE